MCPHELQTHTSTRRFEVSEAGMRELNAGRDPWDLVKELVQTHGTKLQLPPIVALL